MSYLRQPDAWVRSVVHLYHDYEAGVVCGWPDAYTSAAVEAVRTLRAESNACQASLMEG